MTLRDLLHLLATRPGIDLDREATPGAIAALAAHPELHAVPPASRPALSRPASRNADTASLVRITRTGFAATQDELAALLRCTTSAVAHYEAGRRRPDAQTIDRLGRLTPGHLLAHRARAAADRAPAVAPGEIAALRRALGETQTVFGRRLGLARETVRHLERGTRLPSKPQAALLHQIRAGLGEAAS